MHATVRSFVDRVQDQYDFEPEVLEFQETTKTVKAAAQAIGCDADQIAASIVMVVADGSGRPLEERMVVAVVDGTRNVDEGELADALGVDANDLRTASPDEVKDVLGWSIGGVPPFGYDTEVQTILDRRLLDHDRVWGGAGTPKAMVAIDPKRISETAGAEVDDISTE